MKKQLRITSTPVAVEAKPTEQEKKVTLEQSFFQKLKEELKKYEYVTSNEYFKKNFDVEKMKTLSKAWDMYRKLKAKAHEVVQEGFEQYKNCEKKEKDAKLETVIDTYNVIKEKEMLKEKDQKTSTSSKIEPQIVWRNDKKEDKYDHKQIGDIYILLFFGLQLRSLCDFLYTNLNPQKTETSKEEDVLSKQRHEYFNQTIPDFIQKAKQKIYYQDLPNKDKKLVDKISLGYQTKSD
ncbi:hypothetical protein ABPG74_021836 [Tetrahymena malaccensis]